MNFFNKILKSGRVFLIQMVPYHMEMSITSQPLYGVLGEPAGI